MSVREYDTTILRDAVARKYSTQSDFCKAVLPYTDASSYEMIRHKLNGSGGVPSEKVIQIFAKYLDLTTDQVRSCFKRKVGNMSTKKVQAKKNKKATSKSKATFVTVNYEAITKACEDAGLSQTSVCNIVDISTSSFSNWKNGTKANISSVKRIAQLLKVPVTDLYVEDDNESITVPASAPVTEPASAMETTSGEQEKDPVKSALSALVDVSGESNISNIIKTINLNILSLGKALSALSEQVTDEHIDIFKEIRNLKSVVNDLSQDTAKIPDNKPMQPLIAVVHKNNEVDINQLVNGYNDKDTFNDYRYKINSMIGLIKESSNLTHKEILHQFYKEMTAVWGVVYDQLAIDYRKAHGHKHQYGSMELIYENDDFRQVFYNMVASDLANKKLAVK